jgi:Protein of unknown function (DUF2726)
MSWPAFLLGQSPPPSVGLSEVSAEKNIQIQRTAAEFLSRYTKHQKGNFLLRLNSGSSERWVESRGLAFSRVSPYLVTAADRANGIEAIYSVSLDSSIHRTYDSATTKWTDWQNGRHLFIPAAIRVIEKRDGQLTVESSTLSQFTAFTAIGNPDLIPCVRERVIQKPIQVPPNPLQFPQIPLPRNDATPRDDTKPVQPNPMQTASREIVKKVVGLAAVVFVLVVMAGVVTALLGGTRGKRGKNPIGQRQLPPALAPPPLPSVEQTSPDNSLIVGQTHLLTPAEQSFLAVLETIVKPTCAISTKVRLADLFQVRQGRGQQSAFNRISRKHVDFVLTDPATTRILCAIELDDSSHNRPDRLARDQFVDELFDNNQMPLIHIPFEWKYNPEAIRAKLIKAGIPLSPTETAEHLASSSFTSP